MTALACSPRTATALPSARGPLTDALLEALTGHRPTDAVPVPAADALDPYGEDLQLALHLLYELHYRAQPGVADELEWDPALLVLRARLEQAFLGALEQETSGGDDVEAALAPLLLEPVSGTGPSWHLAADGQRWQLRENLAHRSVYHLKEADPQSFVVPRLEGRMKAAVVSVQHDEYGAGRAERMHASLFADAMRGLGLDDTYGAYVDLAPAATLAPVNFMSVVGLHRARRGAAVGQFVMVEVTSSPGSRRLAQAYGRVDGGAAGQLFYDEHVEADAVHEQVLRAGLRDLLSHQPELAADVVHGIEAGLLLEERWAEQVLEAWSQDRTSLRRALPDEAATG